MKMYVKYRQNYSQIISLWWEAGKNEAHQVSQARKRRHNAIGSNFVSKMVVNL